MTATTKKLEGLTAKREALCAEVAEEYIHGLTHPKKCTLKAIKPWLRVVYGLYDKPLPDRVEIAESPAAALKLASELTGEPQSNMDWCGVGDGGWVSFYDYFHRIEVLTDEEFADLRALREFGACAWDSVLLDECAIVIARPKKLRLDDNGNLHSTTEPCIEWADGEVDYAVHGTWVPERMILDPRSYTRDEYLAISNTEQRRALAEVAGWDWLCRLLGATTTDKWTDDRTGLAYELLRSGNGEQFLKQQSPPLADGSQPVYIEPIHENLRTARAARKWQATTETPEACERDPELTYGQEA